MGASSDPGQRYRAGDDRRHRRRQAPDQREVARGGDSDEPARAHGHGRGHRQRRAVSFVRRRLVRQRCHPGRGRRAMAALGADPRRGMTTPAWAAGVCAGVHAAGSRDVVYVPDNPLSHVLGEFETRYPDVRLLLATREEEAFGIAAGLYLGGRRPTVMLQSSGLGNSLNAIASLVVPYQIPMLIVVSMRGDAGEWNAAQVPLGRAVRPIFDALAIPHLTVESADAAADCVRLAGTTAFGTRMPGACILPRRVSTA